MMAKWSLTLLLSKTFLLGLMYCLLMAVRANGARWPMLLPASMAMVSLTVGK